MQLRPQLNYTNTKLLGIDGRRMKASGKVLMPIQVGDTELIEEFIVSDVVSECILGMLSFVRSAEFRVDLSNMTITTHAGYIPLYDKMGRSVCHRVTVARTLTIPANHEMIAIWKY